MTTEDLISRLRTVTVPENRHVGFAYQEWAKEAADRIEAQEREIRELMERRDGAVRERNILRTALRPFAAPGRALAGRSFLISVEETGLVHFTAADLATAAELVPEEPE